MPTHRKQPTTKQRLDLAFKALCEISLLGVEADGQEARRLAQEALRAMGMDHVLVTVINEGQAIRVTSAAGSEENERAMMTAVQESMRAILEAQGTPVEFGEIVMIDDHPKGKGENQ